jgi:hypothetical protein
MTFDQILAHCQQSGYTLTGSSREDYVVDGLKNRFGKTYSVDLINSRSLWSWAMETFDA